MAGTHTGAELFVDILERYGVEHVFGNPGTTELPVVHAVGDSEMEYVLGAHEDIVTGMAAGYASTRRYHSHAAGDADKPAEDRDVLPLGVANLHLAPGLAHGLGNVYGASVTGAPLLVTAGNHSTDFQHEEPILGGDLVEMTDQFTKWSAEVKDVEALPAMVRRAVRVALTPPTGPVFLALPLNVVLDETDAEPERLGPIPTAGPGDEAQLERTADQVVDAEDVALIVGDGVAQSGRDAIDAAVDFAEAAGARVHGEILTSEVDFPTDHDQWVSYVAGGVEIARSLHDADVALFVGTSTHTTLTRHEGPLVPEGTTCVHVSDDVWEIGKNIPADSAIVADPGAAMAELAERVGDRLGSEAREERLEAVADMKAMLEERMSGIGEGDAEDDPRASKAELADGIRNAASDAFVVDEGITSKYVMINRWDMAPEQYISNKGGGLGYGLPAAVGAAVAESMRDDPRDVLGFIGDGSYLYYPHSIYSAVRENLDLTIVIPDNRNYRILKNNTLSIMGGEEEDYDWPGMDFDPPVNIPANAESHGARGHLVETPDEIESAVASAVERDGVDVLDVLVHD